jgi:hypothetical protein
MSTDLVHVPVTGAPDLMAAQFDGQQWASLRHMCDSLGIDYVTQLRKLRSRSWATVGQTPTVAADGKTREMVMVDSRTIPMWLATIDEAKVNPTSRPRLVAYQREARDALDAYFNQRTITAPPVNQFDVLRAAIDQIEAAQREAAEAKTIAERTDARLAAIEGKHDWFSALAYARLNQLPTHSVFLSKLGTCASRIARSHNVKPNPVQHQLYGTVNSYPAWIWDLAAEGFTE